jgi:hypothetical protein
MDKKERLKIAREAQKPITVFDCREYKIEKIPLNYRITIKTERKSNRQAMDRDFYSSTKHGLDYAKEVASDVLEAYFTHRLQSQVKRKSNLR